MLIALMSLCDEENLTFVGGENGTIYIHLCNLDECLKRQPDAITTSELRCSEPNQRGELE